MNEITVRAVQLQHIKTRLMSAPRRTAPGLYEVFHLRAFERLRHRPFLAMGERARRHWRPRVPVVDVRRSRQRPVAFPWTPGARLSAGMTKLDSCDPVLLLYESDETRDRLHKSVVPNAEIADGAAAAPLDLCRFDANQAPPPAPEFSPILPIPPGRK